MLEAGLTIWGFLSLAVLVDSKEVSEDYGEPKRRRISLRHGQEMARCGITQRHASAIEERS